MRNKKDLNKLLYFYTTFDGGVYRSKSKKDKTTLVGNARFIINMRKENLDYVENIITVLEELNIGYSIKDRPDYNSDGFNRQPQVRMESRNHPVLTKIHNRVYIDNKKVIDPHMLTMMDAEALAIIFMADGGVSEEKRFKNPHAYLNLHTKGFSYADNTLLAKTIYEKLGIVCNVRRTNKNYYYITIPKKSHKLFYETVKPFITESFSYKLERLTPTL